MAERSPPLSQQEYLKRIEELANVVCDEALDEGWLSYLPDPPTATRLQRAINELARSLRHVHEAGDGCVEDDEQGG